MTAPIYPAPGEFPDFEQFMLDLFTPIGTTVTSLPAAGDQITATLPFLWVRTVGGTLDGNEVTYIAKVRVVALGHTRTEAQRLAGRAREAMLDAPATRVNGVLIDWAEEAIPAEVKYFPPTVQRSQGVADLPNLDPLGQMVEIGFTLHARRQ
ncbi:hypothetical protein [Nocardia sp. NPDC051570]|uniref:phage tail termination protein n=1 Tax=Nocardia sp. NPDC051570 TaxID=3364324 RepID=UPI00378B7C31